jgi:hypothetical protein
LGHSGRRCKQRPCVFYWLGRILEGVAENAIRRSLCLGGGMNDKPVIRLQFGNPVLDACGCVAVRVLISDARDSAEKGRTISATSSSLL